MAVVDEGAAHSLYVGGSFGAAGSVPAKNVARWDGEAWAALGDGLGSAALASLEFDAGSGPSLYVGGAFARAGTVQLACGVARWDGTEWSGLGPDPQSYGVRNPKPAELGFVRALAVFDDGSGPALYVGGDFRWAGEVEAMNVARWDDHEWSAVGEGVEGFPGVYSLAVHDDGSGPALYAGGYIVGGVVRWDGTSWTKVGMGVGNVEAFAVFDDGAGPALYAGGQFATWAGGAADFIARWDGKEWSEVGGGMDFTVRSLHVFDDGTGPALYAGGGFHYAGGKEVWGIARWDGTVWQGLDGGLYEERGMSVNSMTVFDDGSGRALYVGGVFSEAAGIPVDNVARWRCDRMCYADCDGNANLSFFDFLCFQNLFAAGDLSADCDESEVLDFFDFLCFQNAYAVGCP